MTKGEGIGFVIITFDVMTSIYWQMEERNVLYIPKEVKRNPKYSVIIVKWRKEEKS